MNSKHVLMYVHKQLEYFVVYIFHHLMNTDENDQVYCDGILW